MASLISSVVSFVAESAASAVVQKIVDAGFELLGNLKQPRDSEAELKRLKTALPQIRSAMGIAEALKAKDPSYGEWFEQFQKAVDASEDVLDELEYRKLEEEVKRLEAAGGSTSRSKKQKTCPINRETLGRLREAVSMLDQALGDVDRLLQHAKSLGIDDFSESWKETSKVFRPETTSFLVETKVFGRDEEKEKIFGWLKQSTEEPLSVFGIVGMGGLGKTTLAQLAYQEMKEANYFDHTIWVCVSIEFSFEGLTRKILGELGETNCGDKPLNALQETLKKKVQSQKIFLILDDIWDDDKHWRCWEQFIAPLKFAQEGSKIIFTSRMKSVADLFGRSIRTKHEHEPLILPGLKEEELGSLLYNYAFHGYNPGNHTDLREIGDQIIKMLKGSPLAAKVIGSSLNSNMHRDYWKKILSHGSVLNIDQANDAVEVLKLSYYHLPANLQVCFRFCSIFPQDYEFEKDELIKMWMAAGFIPQQQCQEKQPEDVGKEYFDHLLRKSFFEYSKSWNGERYVMHDLMHDLAVSVSNGECCRVESNDKMIDIPESVRHISVHESEIERISHLENLHSLIITSDPHTADDLDPFVLPKEIIKSLRLLRIFIYRDCQLSEGTSDLVHLRYLSIRATRSTLILAAVHKLYHLQSLYLDLPEYYINSSNLGVELSKLTNLVKLRYMGLPENLLKTIPEIHKLTSLQELTFFIGEGDGHYINELGTLKELRKLSINNIENVGDPVKAKSADLLGKKNLSSLSLNWSSYNNPSTSEQIIENLKPNPDLTVLIITNYEGQRYPTWMKDTPVLNLSVLKLHGCRRLKDELFSCHIPYLKILSIYQCPELDKLPDMPLSLTEFLVDNVGLISLPNFHQNSSGNTSATVSQMSSLKIVKIERCSNLISLDGFLQQANMNLQAIEQLQIHNCEKLMYLPTRGFQNLTSLKSLEMGRCPNRIGCLNLPHSLNNLEISKVALNAIPSLPLSVTRLHISDVPVDALPEYNTSSDSSSGPSTEPLKSSLRDVNIAMCQNITSLNGFLQQEYVDFQSLEKMRITSCWNLVQLPKHAFGIFLSLTELIIQDCPMLMVVNEESNLLPISVKVLTICNCGQIEVQLLEAASRLTALSSLSIRECLNITHIPCSENAFGSLSRLYISGCDKLIEHSSGEPAHGVNLNGNNLASLKINSLCIDNLSLLLIEPLRSLRFVSELNIDKCSEIDTSAQQWLLQNNSTLWRLTFYKATLKSFPGSFVRLTALEVLEINNCDLLEKIQELPSSLRRLEISDAKSLKSLPATMVSLTALEDLHISSSNLLEELPELPDSLRYLELEGAKSLMSLPATMASLTALQELRIWNAHLLQELPELPTSLRYLELEGAKSLMSLPATMASLTALQELRIWNAHLLQELPELPTSLRYLELEGAKSLMSLPATMASLTALQELRIWNAHLLQELPELPTSLRYLELEGAKSLMSLPATMASLTALQQLNIENSDSLHELPELPRSLKFKSIKRSDGTELCT